MGLLCDPFVRELFGFALIGLALIGIGLVIRRW
jgi:hypothetical protein